MLPWLFSGSSSLGPGASASGINNAYNAAQDAVMPLERRIEHLELTCAGLWELLKFKIGCTDEELINAIHHVDARDGVVDGKAGAAGGVCPSCQRKVLTRSSARCSWCGADLKTDPITRG